MSSRKEQKEALRREREQREAQAKAAQRRRRLIGYGAGGVFVAVIVAVLVVVLVSGVATGGGGDSGTQAGGSSDVLPAGGEVPERQTEDLQQAVEAAGCELKDLSGGGVGEHTEDLAETVEYDSNPPTQGRHYVIPAEDGAYEQAPDVKELVHSLEHGRIVIWFRKNLPEDQRANLKAFYDEDTYQMLLAPNETDMPYAVAASAWNREPTPAGTGRLLGCSEYSPEVFDALRAFKDEHRSNGPEAVP
jgi:hypothetical protein